MLAELADWVWKTTITSYYLNWGILCNPRRPQKSPHKWRKFDCGSKIQFAPNEDDSEPLDEEGIKLVQMVVRDLLTENTKKAINMPLDYCAMYPNDGIKYRSSDIVLCGHSDAGFNNKNGSRSRAGAHIFLSEDDNFPRWNDPVLTITHGGTAKHTWENGVETTTFSPAVWQLNSSGISKLTRQLFPKNQYLGICDWNGYDAGLLKISLGFIGIVVRTIMGITTQNITHLATMYPRGRDMGFACRIVWMLGCIFRIIGLLAKRSSKGVLDP